jgi:hypothetical protein
MRRLTIALAVLAATAGCGGDDTPPTHAEFVQQADKICADHNAKIHDKTMDAINQGGLHGDEYRDWFKDILAEEEAIVEGLDGVGRPENDASVERYMDRLHRNLEGLRDALDQDKLGTEAFESAASNSQREARDLAADAGLQECSPLDI